jgi:hypothetical protein
MNVNKEKLTQLVIGCGVVLGITVIALFITLVAVYFMRSKALFIDGTLRDKDGKELSYYDLKVGDIFYTKASDKPSVGTVQGEPIFDEKVVKFLGKEVDNQSRMEPGITGGDLYVNTYRFEVIGTGITKIEVPTNYRGDKAKSDVLFNIGVDVTAR